MAAAPPTSIETERRSHEPSMEEILASIRRIIADDESAPPPSREDASRASRFQEATQQTLRPAPPAAPVSILEPRPRARAPANRPLEEEAPAEAVSSREESSTSAGAWRAQSVDEASEALASPQTAAVVASHFQALAASLDERFVERCAREILRPLLKQWLDDNLPALVERLVRAEIERLARRHSTKDARVNGVYT